MNYLNVVIGMLARRLSVLVLLVVALFVVLASLAGPSRAEQLVASWYGLGDGFAGRTTANGETFDPYAYTAAHKTLPFDTKLEVTYGGESVVVRINDRGPYIQGRDIDLSYIAARNIGLTAAGSAPVEVGYVDPGTPVGPVQTASGSPARNSAPEPKPDTETTSEPAPKPESEPAPRSAQEPALESAVEPAPEPERASAPGAGIQESPEAASEESSGLDQYSVSEQATEVAGDTEATEVTEEQYVDAEQYDQYGEVQGVAEDQYEPPVSRASAPETPRDTPGPEQEVSSEQDRQAGPEKASPATVAPSPAELQEPPAELVQPGSTVEHRIELNVAAEPGTATDSPDTPEPAPVPEDLSVSEAPEDSEDLENSGASIRKPDKPETSVAAGEAPVKEAPAKEAPAKEGLAKEAPAKEVPDTEAPNAEAPDTKQLSEGGGGTQEVGIERLPDTGGPGTFSGVYVTNLVAFLFVAGVLRLGFRRLKA